jgi:hypothetical protein
LCSKLFETFSCAMGDIQTMNTSHTQRLG